MSPCIALVDDQALVRAGLRALLERQGLSIAFEADSGEALLEAIAATPVDVVLSDIRMAGMDGIEALRRLRARGDATPVLLLTTFDEPELLLEATAAGRTVKTGQFPFRALGKATIVGEIDGFAKFVADADTGVLLGCHIIGPHDR